MYSVIAQAHHINATTHVLIYIQGFTHRADLFAVTVVMKLVAVEADEGAIYCVFFSRLSSTGR